jgi:predicted phosphodiesterase
MRALILSDIHGNLEALEAVLSAAEGTYDELWNLGDMVGYGASPNQVIDLIRPISNVVVRGNHDRVCCGLTSPNGFNPVARAAALWTHSELTPENLQWLREVPKGPVQPSFQEAVCVHGSPLDEDQYILTMRDAWAPLQQSPAPLTFFGHTHVQGGFSQLDHNWNDLRPQYGTTASNRNDRVQWTLPLEPNTRHLINPGSVGQPRDHDWRAAYALFDSEAATITFHRVPYDILTAQGRILLAQLPERLASRLREGR